MRKLIKTLQHMQLKIVLPELDHDVCHLELHYPVTETEL